MTVLFDGLIGPSYKPAHMMVCELERGMLMREERLAYRIQAGEVSFEFIREIAESTLPFQNVANLLENIIGCNEWATETSNLKAICAKIIKACNMAADHSKPPVTAFNVMGRMRFSEARKARKSCCGYDEAMHPGKDIVFVKADPDDWDETGRGLKRYPHTYECILHPHMAEHYEKIDTWKDQEVWEERVRKDGYPFMMERRVKDALLAMQEREDARKERGTNGCS